MKEAIVKQDISVDIIDSPVPTPKDDEVVIKVVVSGSNPKDWCVDTQIALTQRSSHRHLRSTAADERYAAGNVQSG